MSFFLHVFVYIMKTPERFNFFVVTIEYMMEQDLPLDILEECFQDHLKVIENKFDIRFHIQKIQTTHSRFVGSSHMNFAHKSQVQESLVWASHTIFSMFEPHLKVPVVLRWEWII